MSSAPPVVLSFAASDPTCGAGVQADIQTIAAMGCIPTCVVTALTVQDTGGVAGVLPVEPRWVAQQARRLLDDVKVSAFKLGVLGSAENVSAVAEILEEHRGVPVVLDPVLASGRGDLLASDEMVRLLLMAVVPRTTVATPNTVEAERLGGAQRLLDLGSRYVLVTGTHAAGVDVVNRLYDRSGMVREDRWKRLPGEYHGSGCTLASALASSIALGRPIPEAAREAQDFTWKALAHAHSIGRAQSIPDRLHAAR
ncbi:MAG TPA: hydroxymethylpyrimidine/phosphomethylpyrimidine kinase [Burkholderiales bacterium]|jgi:hydroxymethylpyrimidine/phosphomethylpyrimidine kinase|nr:hydroxymethylpyrimidine/phosphomethylpyrimidine kinase [Burkholderiales bacterium]